MPDTELKVPKTDLARKTRQILRAVQQGQTVMVESYGQPEAAIIDIADYHILRALLHYYLNPIETNRDGLTEDSVAAALSPQDRFNLVIGNYLAESISLGRAAELLGLTSLDLRTRFVRLDVPLRCAPANDTEGRDDIQTALEHAKPGA